jgi:hypothetical protein
MIYGVSRMSSRPAGKASTFLALALALAAALAGAVLWGLVALIIHRQLSLIGLLIGFGAGSAVARYRPGHRPTIVAGAVIAVAGCALGTFLSIIFTLLDEQVSVSTIFSNLSIILRNYPSAVGGLGLLFWLIAAYAAVRVPLRSQRGAAEPPAEALRSTVASQAATSQVPEGQAPDSVSAANTPAGDTPAGHTPAGGGNAPPTLAPMTDTAPGGDGEPGADIRAAGGYGAADDAAS